jgi:hypothetical protein
MEEVLGKLNERVTQVGRDLARAMSGEIIEGTFDARTTVSELLHAVNEHITSVSDIGSEGLKPIVEQLIIMSQLVRINPVTINNLRRQYHRSGARKEYQ